MPDIRDAWNRAIVGSALPDRLMRLCFALRLYSDASGCSTMGIARLERDTGLGRSTIKRQLQELAAAGFIERFPEQGVSGRGGTTSLTVLRLPGAGSGSSMVDPLPQKVGPARRTHLEPESRSISRGSGSSIVGPEPYRTIRRRVRAREGAHASREKEAGGWPADRRAAVLENSARNLGIQGRGPGESLDELERRIEAAHAASLAKLLELRAALPIKRAPAMAAAVDPPAACAEEDQRA